MAKIKENKVKDLILKNFVLKKLAKIAKYFHFPGGDLSEIEPKIEIKIFNLGKDFGQNV